MFLYFKYICNTNIVFYADVNIALERTLKLKFKTTGSSSCKFVDDFLDTWSEVTAIGGLPPPLVYASATKQDILLRFPMYMAQSFKMSMSPCFAILKCSLAVVSQSFIL